jgi:hypothetical protein
VVGAHTLAAAHRLVQEGLRHTIHDRTFGHTSVPGTNPDTIKS